MLEETLEVFIKKNIPKAKMYEIYNALGTSARTFDSWRLEPLAKRSAEQLDALGKLAGIKIEIKMEKKDANS